MAGHADVSASAWGESDPVFAGWGGLDFAMAAEANPAVRWAGAAQYSGGGMDCWRHSGEPVSLPALPRLSARAVLGRPGAAERCGDAGGSGGFERGGAFVSHSGRRAARQEGADRWIWWDWNAPPRSNPAE